MNNVMKLPCLIACMFFMNACASTAQLPDNAIAPKHTAETVLNDAGDYQIDIYDPWEGFNRSMYKFNVGFDRMVFMPLVKGYRFIMPDLAEKGVSNFFANIDDLNTLANSILQLEGDKSIHTIFRLAMNTTAGLGGLVDVATYLGVPDHDEDFGETLGSYGLGPGPYLVLPILGPSNLRDTAGKIVDGVAFALVDPLNFEKNDLGIAYTAGNSINARHTTGFQYYEDSTPFEYDWVRMLASKQREIEIDK